MATAIGDFKDLKVWQAAMELAAQCYRLTGRLPAQERFGLSMQIRRSAVSVPSNIAEGYGRRSLGDYVRFLRVANGSLKELETQLVLTVRLGMIGEHEVVEALRLCAIVARMLTALMASLKR